jgi:hypothetical protein
MRCGLRRRWRLEARDSRAPPGSPGLPPVPITSETLLLQQYVLLFVNG